MRYVNLGRSGLEVSELGLGTAQFGPRVDAASAREIVRAFADIGGNFIDTANVYGRDRSRPDGPVGGVSEALLGQALAGRRDDFVVATKGYWLVDEKLAPNRVGLSRTYIRRNVEASLRRLGTDYIDLYQCHIWDPYTPLEETLGVLSDLVREGKLRYIGVSNWDGWHIATGVGAASRDCPIVANQVMVSLVDPTSSRSIVPACRHHDVSVIAWGVLAQGFLSGQFDRLSAKPEPPHPLAVNHPWEFSAWSQLATERNFALIDLLRQLARQEGLAVPSIAQRWVIDAGLADVALVGWTSADEVRSTSTSAMSPLRREAVDALSAATWTVPPYPNYFYELFTTRGRGGYGGDRAMFETEEGTHENV